MKYFIPLLLLSCFCTGGMAQPFAIPQSGAATGGNTYAIVIGISDYQDPDIPKLSFSNRDAVVFADFLKSQPGGAVPAENIRLLTDSAATIGEVDKAIRWLMNNCKENDKVYFYFSGHGEMENVTMSRNGYLICYNTPAVAFVNMGLSIDYLNDIVNTISVQTKAKCIVITDACHSGTMAGNKFKGNFFVGEQLMLKKQNEIRMASCKPDELSNEKTDWGGGRGVFSYYLINGLQGGLADNNKDKVVSVGELKDYLETSMARDPVLKNEGDVQTPVIKGNEDFPLSTVIEAETVRFTEQVKNDSTIQVMVMSTMPDGMQDEPAEPGEYFFSLLKKKQLEALTDSARLNLLPTGEIAFAMIGELGRESASQSEKDMLAGLAIDLKKDKQKFERFNLDLAGAFLDIGQNVIANYIRGDEAELERRRYYNSRNNGYDVYTRMFEVAFKLSQADKYYNTKAEVFLHYFSGLALRMKIPVTEDPQPLIEKALAEQKKALALEEYAAYIYNELGVLHQLKKNYVEAEKFYFKATQLSPSWSIPQSNLSSLYISKEAYDKAMVQVNIADSLQNNLQSVSINRGFIYEKKGNLLFAEEDYHHAIEINNRHFLPFERLGYVNMNITNYAIADSFFYEADLRKKGYHFKGNDYYRIEPSVVALPFAPYFCDVDTAKLRSTDIFAFFTWGLQEYRQKRYSNAVRIFKKVIANDKTNPLVFHYMGKIFFDQQKWEEAELMFKFALQYSKDETAFNVYVDSVKRSVVYPYAHDCFEDFFVKSYYQPIEDHYFAGTIYEKWEHVAEAESSFKQVINLTPSDIGGYIKLWKLYEKQGRYTQAEEIIKSYAVVNKVQADRELNTFYRRTIGKFPDNGDWNYRLGLLLYQYAPLRSRGAYFDSIVYFPVLNKEIFIDREIYERLNADPSLSLSDRSATGAVDNIILNDDAVYEQEKNYSVPGTYESIEISAPISLPRKDGIGYLERAAELLSEKEILADISYKIGNIYLWAGSKKQAYPYFEKSLSFVPINANARLVLVDIYSALFKNRAALQQLNYLYDSGQINFEKRVLLAKFNMYAGEFERANVLLKAAEIIHPYELAEIADLKGRSNVLADKPKEAIVSFKSSLKLQAADPWFNNYSIARLYARTGNTAEAFKFLQVAIDMGFNYSFVLQHDPMMDSLRNTVKWKTMINSITTKKYKKANATN